MTVYAPPLFRRDGVVAGFILRRAYTTVVVTQTQDGLGPDGEPVTQEIEVEQVVGSLTPLIGRGVLFAQGVMYRPGSAPALPAMPASSMRNLYYNSIGGFYWAVSPVVGDDAFLGWAVSDGAGVIATSSRWLGGGAETVPVLSGAVVPAAGVADAPNVTGLTAAVTALTSTFVIFGQFDPPGDTTHLVTVLMRVSDHATGARVADLAVNPPYGTPHQIYTVPAIAMDQTATRQYDVTALAENEDGRVTAGAPSVTVTVNPAAVVTSAGGVVGREVPGTDVADPATRLVRFTVGIEVFFVAAIVPQFATYWVSEDNGSHYQWVGWQLWTVDGAELLLQRVKPVAGANWKVAARAGVWGGDPTVRIAGTPAGATASASFAVAGLSLPANNLVTALTVDGGIGGTFPYDETDASGFHDWCVQFIQFDPTAARADANAFTGILTCQDLGAGGATIGEEHIYGTPQVMASGTVQDFGMLNGPYGDVATPSRSAVIVGVRLRLRFGNRANQTTEAWRDATATTLQNLGGVGYQDVVVSVTGATPSGAVAGSRNAAANRATATSRVAQANSANTVPWGGVSGPIDVGGGGAAQTIQEIKNAAGAVVAWFGGKTVGGVDYYGFWGANFWAGGTDPTNPKAWLDNAGVLRLVGFLQGGGIDLLMGLFRLQANASTPGLQVFVDAVPTTVATLSPTGLTATDGSIVSSYNYNGISSSNGKLQSDANGKFTRVGDVPAVGFGLAPIVFRRKDLNQTGSFSYQITDAGAAPVGLYRVNLAATANVPSGSGTGEAFVALAKTWNEGVGVDWDATESIEVNGNASGGLGVGSTRFKSFVVWADGSSASGTVGMQIIVTVTSAFTNGSSVNVWCTVERLDG